MALSFAVDLKLVIFCIATYLVRGAPTSIKNGTPSNDVNSEPTIPNVNNSIPNRGWPPGSNIFPLFWGVPLNPSNLSNLPRNFTWSRNKELRFSPHFENSNRSIFWNGEHPFLFPVPLLPARNISGFSENFTWIGEPYQVSPISERLYGNFTTQKKYAHPFPSLSGTPNGSFFWRGLGSGFPFSPPAAGNFSWHYNSSLKYPLSDQGFNGSSYWPKEMQFGLLFPRKHLGNFSFFSENFTFPGEQFSKPLNSSFTYPISDKSYNESFFWPKGTEFGLPFPPKYQGNFSFLAKNFTYPGGKFPNHLNRRFRHPLTNKGFNETSFWPKGTEFDLPFPPKYQGNFSFLAKNFTYPGGKFPNPLNSSFRYPLTDKGLNASTFWPKRTQFGLVFPSKYPGNFSFLVENHTFPVEQFHKPPFPKPIHDGFGEVFGNCSLVHVPLNTESRQNREALHESPPLEIYSGGTS